MDPGGRAGGAGFLSRADPRRPPPPQAFASVYQIADKEGTFKGRQDLAVKVIVKSSLRNLQEVAWLDQEIILMKKMSGSLNVVHGERRTHRRRTERPACTDPGPQRQSTTRSSPRTMCTS